VSRRAVAWRGVGVACSAAMILTLVLTSHAWWPLAALFLVGVWAAEKAAQRATSRVWRQHLDRFGGDH
jgi:hypothetical protein